MRLIKKLLFYVFLILFIASSILIAGGWGKYKQAISQLSIEDAAKNIKTEENFTPIDDVSLTFVNAIVAVEDRRFYQHKGIDIIGLGRAIKKNIKEKSLVEGGSCITQQLAKNIYFMNDNTLSRKIAEIFVAMELEKAFSKKEILELYFNVIYYGSGYYNIYDASQGYFNKDPYNLSDYEATLLAGIPNAPSVYSLNNNPELAKKRQKTVVKAMVDMKYLSQEEANSILSQQ